MVHVNLDLTVVRGLQGGVGAVLLENCEIVESGVKSMVSLSS
jgi:hypothetical protein